MDIKLCPLCGHLPKISESFRRKGRKPVYFIGCPNMCWVLQSPKNSWQKVNWLRFEGNYTYDFLWKQWNGALIDG